MHKITKRPRMMKNYDIHFHTKHSFISNKHQNNNFYITRSTRNDVDVSKGTRCTTIYVNHVEKSDLKLPYLDEVCVRQHHCKA